MSARVTKKDLLSKLKVRDLRRLALEEGVKATSKKTKSELMGILQRRLTLAELKGRIERIEGAA